MYTLVFLGISIWLALSFMMTPLGTLHLTRFFLENRKQDNNLASIKIKYVPHNRFIDKLIFRRRNIPLILIAAVIISSLFSYGIMYEFEDQINDVGITAHRGNVMYAPENTISAIRTASFNGADYAEIDIQQTLDGELVLLHDVSLRRTTGLNKKIWEVRLDEVKTLDAGVWFDDKFINERVPTLSEAISESKGKIKLNIEIKSNGHEQEIVRKVIEEIYKFGIEQSCVVTSLDYDILQEVETLAPELKTGYIMFVAMGDISKLNVDFYSVEEMNINESFVTRAHLLGREVHVWTINESDDMTELINLGVDNIITDNEVLLREKLDAPNTKNNVLGVIDQFL